jgi:ABC-type transport system involved in cytochrome c biogenesis permease component
MKFRHPVFYVFASIALFAFAIGVSRTAFNHLDDAVAWMGFAFLASTICWFFEPAQ